MRTGRVVLPVANISWSPHVRRSNSLKPAVKSDFSQIFEGFLNKSRWYLLFGKMFLRSGGTRTFAEHLKISPDMSGESGGFCVLCCYRKDNPAGANFLPFPWETSLSLACLRCVF